MTEEHKLVVEDNYSKRELDDHFKEVKDGLAKANEGIKDLNTKVGIQNGRVTKTEGTVKGALMAGTVAVFLVGIIMSLVVYSFKISQDNLKNSILLEIKDGK